MHHARISTRRLVQKFGGAFEHTEMGGWRRREHECVACAELTKYRGTEVPGRRDSQDGRNVGIWEDDEMQLLSDESRHKFY
jgi:hypothetical protein